MLLAIDLGLKRGWARYDKTGRLRAYHSQHFGNRSQLKRAVWSIMSGGDAPLEVLVMEGDRGLGELFAKLGRKWGVEVVLTDAHAWRPSLMDPKHRRSGEDAKAHADRLARAVITASGAPEPTALRHDAAEAILVGLWAVLEREWVDAPPW